MNPPACFDNLHIVLHRPRFPENIGAAARAMRNMGLSRLMVVEPENFDLEKIRRLATHEAAHIVDGITRHGDLATAVGPMGYVAGTTARLGGERQAVSNPSEMAEKLVSMAENNPVAVVFGPEDRGLTNEEIRLCHGLVNIPTAAFSSLNLAQAVMVLCYELFQAGRSAPPAFSPRLASRHELDGMYDQLKHLLVRIHYILPENPDYWMNKLRLFFSRMPLRAREVAIIRGICRQMDWYGEKCYLDGREGRPPDPALDIEEGKKSGSGTRIIAGPRIIS